MNIVIANDYATICGGAEQVAISSARGLAERGHQVTFFSPIGPERSELLNHKNLTVVSLGKRVAPAPWVRAGAT